LPRQESDCDACKVADTDYVRRRSEGRDNRDLPNIDQARHLIQAAAANDADADSFHEEIQVWV